MEVKTLIEKMLRLLEINDEGIFDDEIRKMLDELIVEYPTYKEILENAYKDGCLTSILEKMLTDIENDEDAENNEDIEEDAEDTEITQMIEINGTKIKISTVIPKKKGIAG